MGLSLTIEDLAAAIEREENVDPSKNNPGAITSGGVVQTFPTLQAGQSALTNQLNLAVTGQSKYYDPNESLEQFEETYTGGDMNAGSNVASFLGVSPSTPISSFSPQIGGSGLTSSNGINSWFQSPGANIDPNTLDVNTPQGSAKLKGLLDGEHAKEQANNGVNLIDGITVVVGLILVAGAVFGFKSLQTTIVSGVKMGAGAATL